VAPSFGVSGFPYEDRYFNAKKKLEALGYTIKEAEHLYGIEKAASADGKTRAQEFMEMYLDDEVDFVISVAGGELMMEILPYIDFEKLRQARPKFFMGLSDNTNLTFTLPVLTDTAAIYGNCFGSFGMEKWYRSLKENLKTCSFILLRKLRVSYRKKADYCLQRERTFSCS
ncbi:MAG: LD-carboxypeptidase, partial [Treponema sp.]|nr:LD-carboxypeptidase [Treponema sp.]